MFIIMARTVWGFNLKLGTGPDGNPIEVAPKSQHSFIMLSVRQRVILIPRSEQHAMAIEKRWQEAQNEGLSYTRAKCGKT